MDKANLKTEMMKQYEAELDSLLSNCSGRQNFKVLEDELEKFAKATLPRMLERLAPLCISPKGVRAAKQSYKVRVDAGTRCSIVGERAS
jgi:hypothetical protein